MDFTTYLALFERIINNPNPQAPYDKPEYLDYARLNWSRMNRWLKKGQLNEALVQAITRIDAPQQWIVITEPWCGDAAHSIPFLHLAGELNSLISVHYEQRDAEPFRINDYLTGGGKSIPKLIIRDNNGQDLAVWGPRPAACQELYQSLKDSQADFEQVKTELQHWYNHDKGKSLQVELLGLLSGILPSAS